MQISLPPISENIHSDLTLHCPPIVLTKKINFLLGPNGSGKSSYLRALNTSKLDLLLLPPQQEYSEDAYVDEFFDIFDVSSKHTSPMWNSSSYKNILVSKLSSGERQRLFLHLHCHCKKSFHCFDEPTNFLDPFYKHQLTELLSQRKNHSTYLIATHDLSWASQFDDSHFLLMDEAKITNQGPCKDLVESLEMQKAFQMQFRLTDNNLIDIQPL